MEYRRIVEVQAPEYDEVTAFCVGDLWLGTSSSFSSGSPDTSTTTAPTTSPGDFLENLVFYAVATRLIRIASVLPEAAGPAAKVIQLVHLAPAEPALIVGLAATTARHRRRYSELAALDINGTVTLFVGTHVRLSSLSLHFFSFATLTAVPI